MFPLTFKTSRKFMPATHYVKQISLSAVLLCSLSVCYAQKSPANGNSANSSTASSATPNEVYNLKISFSNQENSPKGKTLIKFKSLVETKSNGRIKIELYPFNRLLKEQDELEALELGVTDIVVPISSKVANDLGVKEYQMFDLPYLFASQENFAKLLDSDVNNLLLQKVNEKNKTYTALAFWGNGFRGVSTNKPVQTVKDFQGLLFGLQYSEPTVNTFKALGANVVKMTEDNIPKALNVKTANAANLRKIDATDSTMSSFNFYQLYQNQRYFINTNHAYSVYTVLMNERKLKSLPEDIQKILISTAASVQTYHYEVAEEDNQKSAAVAKEKGVTVLDINENDTKGIREKAMGIHEDFVKQNRDLMVKVYSILK